MHADGETSLLPLFLKLAEKTVLVVGAGSVAERKIESLLEAGARVRVVAPEATEGVQRPFDDEDAADVWLAFAATSDAEVQARVARATGARRVFCVAVDDPANASAYSGALVRRPPFTVAISSGGATPALTRLVREVVRGGDADGRPVRGAGARRQAKREVTTPTAASRSRLPSCRP